MNLLSHGYASPAASAAGLGLRVRAAGSRTRDAAAARIDGRERDRSAGLLLRHAFGRRRPDRDRDVRHALALEGRAALRARIQPLGERAARAAVDGDFGDEQAVGRHVVIVLGVGHRAAQQLLDRLGGEHAGELEQHERFAHGLAADRIGDPAQLARAHAGELEWATPAGARRESMRRLIISPNPSLGPPWPLKSRVGENSPSLCPTMFSVTNTGMWVLPLCTEIVWPTIGGMIVERDQVLITRFSRVEFSFSTFAIRWSATNGPFLRERPITSGTPLANDHLRRALVAARLFAHRHLAPRRGRRAARGGARFTAAVRMVDRVHRDTAHRRALAHVALAAGFADRLRSRARRCRADRSSRGRRSGSCALRPRACGPARTRLPWPSAAPTTPALRTSLPPSPGRSSMLWITVPSGMFESGSALPILMSAFSPDSTTSPTFEAERARGCSASRRRGSGAARCGPSGWDRTRSPRPWPESRPWRA